ncbi:putative DUF3108 domain-containing protein [Gammaproteobacteria bacterium]
MHLLTITIALFLCIGNASAAHLSPFQADYEFRVNGMVLGETTFDLSRENEYRWIYTHSTRPMGILAGIQRDRRERSIFILDNGYPQPVEFQGRDALRSKPREGFLRFDWGASIVSGAWNGQPWQVPLEGIVHDPLTYQLAIMLDLAKGASALNYLVAEDAKLKSYHFEITGKETLQTLAGPFDTVRLERTQDSDKRRTILWCAPILSYLPVKIEQQDSGTHYVMVLRAITGLSSTH